MDVAYNVRDANRYEHVILLVVVYLYVRGEYERLTTAVHNMDSVV